MTSRTSPSTIRITSKIAVIMSSGYPRLRLSSARCPLGGVHSGVIGGHAAILRGADRLIPDLPAPRVRSPLQEFADELDMTLGTLAVTERELARVLNLARYARRLPGARGRTDRRVAGARMPEHRAATT
jgi:hypothetical protein